uniref:Uncharacterized protein n=1 Tax=Romanomermis culicivorax TaxID=13658 RepID=A0A915JE74_ROMCU
MSPPPIMAPPGDEYCCSIRCWRIKDGEAGLKNPNWHSQSEKKAAASAACLLFVISIFFHQEAHLKKWRIGRFPENDK